MQEFGCDVAIIGVAGRFPGAPDLDRFWHNLRNGVESISFFDDDELISAGVPVEEFSQADYVKAGARTEGIDLFDAEFFGYTPREATIMDPQHRVFLETAWEALENAGYSARRIDTTVGVFGGAGTSAYLPHVFANLDDGAAIGASNVGLGNELGFLTTRVSYKLDLQGPSIPVHTACSSSLVAVHLACQSLLNHESGMALAGGVAFKVSPQKGYRFQESGIMSPDGHCRPFDADSRGTVFNNGVGVVLLKRLADALADNDTVHAVIKGTAVNNDGATKASFSAPAVAGQSSVVLEALDVAGVEADSISYVEAHGSGTQIGDSIEIEALTRAFFQSTERTGYCTIGSVKSNVGHLDAASGMAGLLKTTLSLRHGMLPPTLHFDRANPQIDFDRSPFRVQRDLTLWESPDGPRRAGVSAFGFGGTNAHVVLEEAPERPVTEPARPSQLLVLSARTPEALERATDRLAEHLRREPQALVDVAFTLAQGREEFRHRRTVVASSSQEAAQALEDRDPAALATETAHRASAQVAMLFTGQGSQHPGMARELYHRETEFRAAVDRCAEGLRDALGMDVRDLLLCPPDDAGAAELLTRTEFAQPALFTVEYALAVLWSSWGVTPTAMAGHSLGEYVAACLAGVFTLGDALRLVALRGRLMQEQAPGAMLSVSAGRSTVEARLPDGLTLAAHNGPADCVVAGAAGPVAEFAAILAADGIGARPVATSHAFHTPLMAPMVEEFVKAVSELSLTAPHLPFVSNVTGDWITDEEATDPAYWGAHVLSTVEFAKGIETLAADDRLVFLEVGPGQTLRSLVTRQLAEGEARVVVGSLPHARDVRGQLASVQRALGLLWQAGVAPDWSAYHREENPGRVALPTYPFERRRYWLDPAPTSVLAAPAGPAPHALLDELLLHTVDEVVFRTEFDLERHWVLSEHRMLAEAIVPGTTYLEMARAAGSALFGTPVTVVSDVEFQVPLLVTADRPRVAHTIVRAGEEGGAEFRVVSHDPDAAVGRQWTLHVRGRVAADPQSAPAGTDPAEFAARCGLATMDGASLQAGHRVMEFGSRWQESLRTVDVGVRCALGSMALPTRFREETADYVLHPALLDLATGFHRWAMFDGEDEQREANGDFYLPLAYDRLVVHGPMPASCVSVIEPDPRFQQSGEIRKVDVMVHDPAGAVVLEIKGFTAKRVNSPRRTIDSARGSVVHHTLNWVRADRGQEGRRDVRTALVVGAGSALLEATAAGLRAAGVTVATAPAGTDWASWPDPLPSEIVYVAGDAADGDGTEGQERLLDEGVVGLLELARALAGAGAGTHRITVVAQHVHHVTGDEPRLVPAHSALFGLAKVIGQEHQEISCRCVDVGDDLAPAAWIEEILCSDPLGQIALRGTGRYAAELDAVDLAEAAPEHEASAGEVHLITGGMGGLGLEVARSISLRRPRAGIALVGRSAIPARAEWDEVLSGGGRTAARIGLIQEMEARGTRVVCLQGDVADAQDMARVVAAVRAELGAVTHVVHAAGTAGDGFLLRKSAQTFRATLAPKADGAVALHEATLADRPVMVLFSSTTALFGSAGQSDYTAANQYLDGFAAWRNKAGLRTFTVNWTDWIGTGMAADHGVRQDQGFFRSVGVEEGIASYEAILRGSYTQVIVGEINYGMLGSLDPAALRARMATAPLRLAESIQRTVSARSSAAGPAVSPTPGTVSVRLTGRADGGYTELERTLAGLWAAEFGISDINVFASLFDLGGDSLLALRLANSLQKALGVKLTIADLFAHLTVADLAAYLAPEEAAVGEEPAEDSVAVPPTGQDPADETWFELWNGQQGMWLQHQLGEDRADLNLPVWHYVHEAVDVTAFREAVGFLVERHDALRLSLQDTEHGPRQRVLPRHDLDVPLVDVTGADDPEEESTLLIQADNAVPFDDLSVPPVRAKLYKLAENHYCAYLNVHHIVADGTSMGNLLRELLVAYRARVEQRTPELEPLTMSFSGFVQDRQKWLSGPESAAMEAYWTDELKGPLPRLRIGDHDAHSVEVVNDTLDFEIGPDLATAVAELARGLDATVHVVLLSAFVVALHDIGSDEDIVMCVPFSGRDTKEMEGMVGAFVNPLSVRIGLTASDSFGDVVRRAQRKSVASYANSRYPFARLLERLAVPARPGQNPVFSSAFQFTDFLPPAYQTSQLDVCLYGKPSGDGLSLRFNYNSSRLSKSEIVDIQATFLAALSEAARDAQVSLESLAEPLREARKATRTTSAGGRRPGGLRLSRPRR
ncbi:type I polyketide synthase [Streptomyces peucetius]|uniref:SDR family NAD(P)-dependent oxidoreductase n=1 Tax=Streptomyces peucetius TaxID=1950 RepID=A0ABY6I4K1_STRPE|nr:type I polyketide synthase [Streptomyces peucetius]UYQ60934.1 SDR family NAD(P)-dependent oxidoreductase [Streptomyces peucetius]